MTTFQKSNIKNKVTHRNTPETAALLKSNSFKKPKIPNKAQMIWITKLLIVQENIQLWTWLYLFSPQKKTVWTATIETQYLRSAKYMQWHNVNKRHNCICIEHNYIQSDWQENCDSVLAYNSIRKYNLSNGRTLKIRWEISHCLFIELSILESAWLLMSLV